jgi:hypothetical protein
MKTAFSVAFLVTGLVLSSEALAEPAPCSGEVNYQAVALASKTYLFARVTLPTTGWTVAFKMRPEKIFPPQYTLLCTKPSGEAGQMVTPYTSVIAVAGVKLGTILVVYDAQGRHEVPVWMEIPADAK